MRYPAFPLTPALSRANSPWRVRNLARPHPQADAVGRGSALALATASLLPTSTPLRAGTSSVVLASKRDGEKDRMRGFDVSPINDFGD